MVEHTSLESLLLELSWTLFAVTLLVLILRIVGEVFIVRSFKLPSWIAVLAFLMASVSQVMVALAIHNGLGRHIQSLSHDQNNLVQTYIWQAQPLQLLANTTGKISIAALLVTLHGPKHAKARKIFVWSTIALQVIFMSASLGLIYSQCTPSQKLWRPDVPGTCNHRDRNRNFGYVQGSVSSLVDVALAIYPILLFWNLQIELAKKLSLSLLFAFGLVAATSAIMRTSKIGVVAQTKDLTYAVAELVLWNTIEMYFVLIGGSLPGLRPLFNKRIRIPSNRDSTYDNSRPPTAQCDKRSFVMRLSRLPATHSRAYAGIGSPKNSTSTDRILQYIGPRNILKTTEVNVSSGRNSTQGHRPSNSGHEQYGTEV